MAGEDGESEGPWRNGRKSERRRRIQDEPRRTKKNQEELRRKARLRKMGLSREGQEEEELR